MNGWKKKNILSEVTQTQKVLHGIYSAISKYYPPNYRILRIQSTELKKVNKLKGPREDALIPLGRYKKAITEGRDLNRRKDRESDLGSYCSVQTL